MVGAGFAKVFTAYIFIAALSVLAAKPAEFIAKEFNLDFLGLGQVVQLFKFFIYPEIRHNIAEVIPIQFRL